MSQPGQARSVSLVHREHEPVSMSLSAGARVCESHFEPPFALDDGASSSDLPCPVLPALVLACLLACLPACL
jgi:hypothetical protein